MPHSHLPSAGGAGGSSEKKLAVAPVRILPHPAACRASKLVQPGPAVETADQSLPFSGRRPGSPAPLPTRFGLSWPAGKEGEGAARLERNFPPRVGAELGRRRKWVGPNPRAKGPVGGRGEGASRKILDLVSALWVGKLQSRRCRRLPRGQTSPGGDMEPGPQAWVHKTGFAG